jgi:hypothetical protein
LRIEPNPTPDEAAAIIAALETLREEEPEDGATPNRSRWRLAGLLGHAAPARMKLEGSLWSYSSREGMT